MIKYIVDYETVMEDYSKKAKELINILQNTKYKDTNIEDIQWSYSFNYYMKKKESTPEYYEELTNLLFEDRLESEIKKVRVSLGLNIGHFGIVDRVRGVSESIKNVVKIITIQKMIYEQEIIGNIDVLNSIPKPDIDDNPISLEEQLKIAVDIEDYMEAARLRDIINGEKKN